MSAHRDSGQNVSALGLWLKPAAVWLALLLLLGLTVGSAYVPLGAFNGIINYGVATAKAALVLIFFMHLDRSRGLLRLAALTGLFWLLFLFSLAFGDYLTRNWNGSSTALHDAGEHGAYPQTRLPLNPRFGRRD
jgi:cytochrome c oxidase subunit 4